MRCKSNENLFIMRCLWQSSEALCYRYNWLNDRSFALWAACVCVSSPTGNGMQLIFLLIHSCVLSPPPVSQSLSQTQSVSYLCRSPQLSILIPHAPPTETTVWILWHLKRLWSLFAAVKVTWRSWHLTELISRINPGEHQRVPSCCDCARRRVDHVELIVSVSHLYFTASSIFSFCWLVPLVMRALPTSTGFCSFLAALLLTDFAVLEADSPSLSCRS